MDKNYNLSKYDHMDFMKCMKNIYEKVRDEVLCLQIAWWGLVNQGLY